MAKQAKKKAAEALKFWRVEGSQTEYVSRDRYVEAATPEEAREKARQGDDVIREEDTDKDWGKWQSEDFADLSDIEEVSEAEAKGTEEQDAPNLPGLCPLWETIAPTLEQPGGPGYLLGHIDLLGVRHHVEFIRAKWDKDNVRWVAHAKDDADNEERLCELQDGKESVWPRNVKLPGRRGSWLLVVEAYSDR